jgi:hypothetical protein|tara:strand:+ start:2811 stop:4112 length:1302 start_codon:yes stop_codon:yes gene_type:complete
MKINSKTFYKNHINEISRYYSANDSVLHVVNSESNIQVLDDFYDTLKIDISSQNNLMEFYDDKKYDLVVITDLFELSDDIYLFLKNISKFINSNGKLLITSINPKWNNFIKVFEILKLKNSTKKRNYIPPKKINNIAKSTGFEMIHKNTRQILPFSIFGLGAFINKIFEFLLSLLNIGIKTYTLFRFENSSKKEMSKSIIIPAKNEEGNLEELLKRIPNFKGQNEILIVCGKSKDNTLEKSHELANQFKEKNISVFEQTSKGKAGAVYEVLNNCSGELIAILDADISVDPETLNDFFEIIENGYADFVNGTRLIYGKEKNAMRFLNSIGNLFFQFLISIVIKQKLTDSLCGTKIFKKENLDLLYDWQKTNIVKDPFGDFDLIFSAAYSGQKILEYPVHYRSRKYGSTQISRFKDGWKLLSYFMISLYKFNVSK